MPLAFFEKQYKASAHPRVLSRAMTEAQVTKFLHDGMSKHVNANNFISEEAFMNYYLDTSCMMPAALDNFF
jgi:Ca2+-binding EF-hand superfamily protein